MARATAERAGRVDRPEVGQGTGPRAVAGGGAGGSSEAVGGGPSGAVPGGVSRGEAGGAAERTAPPTGLPAVTIATRGAVRLRAGHPFVSREDVRVPPSGGDVVLVQDERGGFLGSALWAGQGPIALRRLCPQGRSLTRELLAERIAFACELRRGLFASSGDPVPDALRVVHGEADGLPGLFVDRYDGAAVIQTATAAMDAREELIAEAVVSVLGVRRVFVRDDGSARDMEGLPRRKGALRDPDGSGPRARYHDAGSPVEVDLLADGKTGGFLDQTENHAAAARYARALCPPGGTALDAFTYHGGFALALSRAGLSVIACDESAAAIERARHNAALGGQRVDFRVKNAFDLLRHFEAEGRRFDVVVIDPPALAKRGQPGPAAQAAAQRAYKELNLRGLRLLAPGGVLVTCSCSGRVSPADFGVMLASAARDAGVAAQVLERRGAGRDHPVLLTLPESEYLKCWILRRPR